MDRKPLVAVSHVEVGAQVSVEPVDEVIAGIHCPRLGAEYRGEGRYGRTDQAVVPRCVHPEAESFPACAVLLVEIHRSRVPYDVAVHSREGYVVQISGGVRHAEGIFQPAPVLHRGRRQGVENDAAVSQFFHAHPERYGQGVAVRAGDVEVAESDSFGSQETAEDVVASCRDPQSEIGQDRFERIHIDVLRADLLRQHPGAPGRGGGQRIERFGGGERERQIAGGQSGAGGCGVGAERDVCPADAVRAVFAADYDAVQRETCGHAAGIRSGSVGVERKRSADLLRGDSHVGQIEVEDIARHADPLFPLRQRSRNGQQQTERFVAVGKTAGEVLVFEVRIQLYSAEIVAPVLRAADPHPDASPCLRQQRIESGAPGRQREIQCAQRVGRKEPVQRKAVASDFRIVYLFFRVDPAVQRQLAAVGVQRRGERVKSPVRVRRSAERDPFGNRHAPPQGRVGQHLQQKSHVAELPFETGRGFQPLRGEQVFRGAVHRKVDMSGRRDVQPRLFDVAQRSRRRKLDPDDPVVQRGGNQLRIEQFYLLRIQARREVGGQRGVGRHSHDSGSGVRLGPDAGKRRRKFEPGERNAGGVHCERSGGIPYGQPAALGKRQPADPKGDVGAPVVDRIDRQVERREDDERRIESRRGAVVQRSVFEAVVVQRDAADPDGPRQGGSFAVVGRCVVG